MTESDTQVDIQPANPATRTLPPLDIRPFQSQDVIPIRQLIADNTLQLSRLTNQKIYFHPMTIAAYFACLGGLIHFSNVMVTHDWGRLTLFTAALTSAFLVAGEMVTRSRFEALATNILRTDPSLLDIQKFFGNDKFLVATLGDEVIGLVGLQIDGRIGIVRHWGVASKYRNRGLGWDLLDMVIANNKGSKKNGLQSVKCETYSLQERAEKSLKDHGFESKGKQVKESGPIGWFGVKRRTWVKKL